MPRAAQMPLMREVLDRGDRLAVTAVLLAGSKADEPSEADVRIELSPGAAATVEERRGDGGRLEGVWPDAADTGLCEAIARTLAPLRLEDRDSGPAKRRRRAGARAARRGLGLPGSTRGAAGARARAARSCGSRSG